MVTLNRRSREPLESAIQHHLVESLQRQGWYVQKTEGCSRNGFPDVTAVGPDGTVWFIELKRTVGRPSWDQWRELRSLASHHANVMLLYGRKAVDTLLAVENRDRFENHDGRLLIIDSGGVPKWSR